MSSMRSQYRELGLELVELGEHSYRRHRNHHMVGEEKRYYGVGDPSKLLLEEALM